MATIISNKATSFYRYENKSVESNYNTSSITLNESLLITKCALSQTYKINKDITYIVSIQNGSGNDLMLNISDDLGTYNVGGHSLTPLIFIGSALLFINGVFESNLTPTIHTNEIIFYNVTIPQRQNATIIYSACPNQYADFRTNGKITNTVTVFSHKCPCPEVLSTSTTICAESFAELQLFKSVYPNTVVCGEEITYTIDVYNYGNSPATDITLTDNFTPPLKNISVFVDGLLLTNDDYSYNKGLLTLPSENSTMNFTAPAATIKQNPQTYVFETTPSRIQIKIIGRI